MQLTEYRANLIRLNKSLHFNIPSKDVGKGEGQKVKGVSKPHPLHYKCHKRQM